MKLESTEKVQIKNLSKLYNRTFLLRELPLGLIILIGAIMQDVVFYFYALFFVIYLMGFIIYFRGKVGLGRIVVRIETFSNEICFYNFKDDVIDSALVNDIMISYLNEPFQGKGDFKLQTQIVFLAENRKVYFLKSGYYVVYNNEKDQLFGDLLINLKKNNLIRYE